jgi:hypothetical protein
LPKIRYMNATMTGTVMRNNARRTNSHSHQDSSAVCAPFLVSASILAEDLRFRGRGILTTVGAPALLFDHDAKEVDGIALWFYDENFHGVLCWWQLNRDSPFDSRTEGLQGAGAVWVRTCG